MTSRGRKISSRKKRQAFKPKPGAFTLIELLTVIAIIVILMAIVLVAVNPGRQLRQARNAKRKSDINALTKALMQYQLDHDGKLEGLNISEYPEYSNIGTDDLNLETALVPLYIAKIPIDPEGTCSAVDTCYDVCVGLALRPNVIAPNMESEERSSTPSSPSPSPSPLLSPSPSPSTSSHPPGADPYY